MELVLEEYGQTLLAVLVMTMGIGMLVELIANEGILNEMVLAYMSSISG